MAGSLVLAAMLGFCAMFAPIYIHNLQLQNFVAGITRSVENRANSDAVSDAVLRGWVLDKAHQLQLPVMEDNVLIIHSREGVRIEVRYFVPVSFPGYTVTLHFYPGAGSR